ncbi:MAG: hypothetical protein AAF995_01120 [Planctomycetota bacterium]
MQREDAHPESMDMGDFLCDYCEQAWSLERHMVEGHRGACVCSNCLTIAWTEIVAGDVSDQPEPEEACALCRETGRAEAHWRSPMTGKLACKRCVKQSAGVLHKDRDIEWSKPG